MLDKSQWSETYSSADFVPHPGIPTGTDAAHAIALNKVMAMDWETVVTGSFNFTSAEERNEENLLMLRSEELAKAYAED